MEYTATSKYIRTSPRKMRLVADSVRSLTPLEAIDVLTMMPKHAGRELADVIASAVANAGQKNVQKDQLRFQSILVMGGPVMKRWHAVSRGSAHGYKKRMTHVRIILTEKAAQAGKKESNMSKKERKQVSSSAVDKNKKEEQAMPKTTGRKTRGGA